jgi:hypothetical protein
MSAAEEYDIDISEEKPKENVYPDIDNVEKQLRLTQAEIIAKNLTQDQIKEYTELVYEISNTVNYAWYYDGFVRKDDDPDIQEAITGLRSEVKKLEDKRREFGLIPKTGFNMEAFISQLYTKERLQGEQAQKRQKIGGKRKQYVRKTKNRKTKNRKTKNRKTKNRKTKKR